MKKFLSFLILLSISISLAQDLLIIKLDTLEKNSFSLIAEGENLDAVFIPKIDNLFLFLSSKVLNYNDISLIQFGVGYEGLIINPYLLVFFGQSGKNNQTYESSVSSTSTDYSYDSQASFGILFGGEYDILSNKMSFIVSYDNITQTFTSNDVIYKISTNYTSDENGKQTGWKVSSGKNTISLASEIPFSIYNINFSGLIAYSYTNKNELASKIEDDEELYNFNYNKRGNYFGITPKINFEAENIYFKIGIPFVYENSNYSAKITNTSTMVNSKYPEFLVEESFESTTNLYLYFSIDSNLTNKISLNAELLMNVISYNIKGENNYQYKDLTNIDLENFNKNSTDTTVTKTQNVNAKNYYKPSIYSTFTLTFNLTQNLTLSTTINQSFLSDILLGKVIPYIISGNTWKVNAPFIKTTLKYNF